MVMDAWPTSSPCWVGPIVGHPSLRRLRINPLGRSLSRRKPRLPPIFKVRLASLFSRTATEETMDEGRPISYEALAVGTPVVSSTGSEFGRVHHVLQVPELDLFDGISVKTRHGLRFVDRDQITEITTTVVRCALTDDEAAALPAPTGPPVVEVDLARYEGTSLTARLGRLFGRPHWKNIDE